MLYVFFVETGTMLSLDMKLTMEDANAVKEAIKKITGIPLERQVLLASGGEMLESEVKVCTYSAGTDTNPIYLFTREAATVPTASVDHIPDHDMKEEVDASLNLPPTIHTVNVRCQLAQQICEQAKHICRMCEKLVHEQHLQQQGWAAVIANLEDVTVGFARRCEQFESCYNQYLETRQEFLEILDSFPSDIGILSEIPILPALAEKERELKLENEESKSDETEETTEERIEGEEEASTSTSLSSEKPQTLLDWISDKDRQYRVDQVADLCRKGLEQLDEAVLAELKGEMTSTIDIASKYEYREIKGLEDRLFGLDQLKTETEKLYQEQVDLAQAFVQNQLRASNLGDTSILPDLCASHKRQLIVMLKNHNQLRDIKRRCINAKQELVNNLHHRLKWVIFIECRINEMLTKLIMYHECLKRVRMQLTILQQIHLAATVYLNALSEVVRRREFSLAYRRWANDLACQIYAVYLAEVAQRKNFNSQFDGHFLTALIPGLDDMPPSFATQPPQSFDDNLPLVKKEDIEKLKTELPKISLLLSVPDTTSFTQFFLSRSSANLKPEPPNPTASIEDRIVEAVTAAGLSSNLDPALLQPATEFSQSMAQSATTTTQPISSDRGFESETDTEEFEKVGQSPIELHFEKHRESMIRQEKEDPLPEECESIGVYADEMKSRLQTIRSTVGEAVFDLKNDFGQLKQWFLCERTELECLVSKIQEACSLQQETLKREIEEKEKALEKLSQSREKLKKELCNLREEKKAQESIKDKKMLAVTKKVEGERKSRCNTRSVSESQLVSSELKGSVLDIKEHNEIVARLKEQMTLEKEKAVLEERARCETRLSEKVAQAIIKSDANKQAIYNECTRRNKPDTRSRSQDVELSKSEVSVNPSLCSESKILDVSEEKNVLPKLDVTKSLVASSSPKSGKIDVSPSSSIVTIESNQSLVRDAATSPEPSPRKCRVSKEKLSESTNSLIQQGKISVGTCNEGDIVLVIWDENYQTYTILQELTPHIYFLHHESLLSLGLRANPRKQYVIGEVVNKEYCQAKKAENRYNVPVGSRFYRVRVRPLHVKTHG